MFLPDVMCGCCQSESAADPITSIPSLTSSNQHRPGTGEDRRTAGKTCALLLATACGRASDAAAVPGDAGSDRAATDTDGIARGVGAAKSIQDRKSGAEGQKG